MPDVQPPKPAPKGLGFALDFGPLLIFFVTNYIMSSKENPARGALIATGVFMIAIIAAIVISKWKLGRVSTMMWVSGILVVSFGGITLLLGDPVYIQIKPTVIYVLFAAILFGGLLRGKALLKYLLEYAFDGVSDIGWKKLSRNWAFFFLAMAAVNEVLRQMFDFSTWLTLKVWGVTALFFVFNMTQIPMLLRHGLKLVDDKAE
ncbi:MAG: inner membrane-spanning protein YciB [Sphingorhabdus sp.]